MARPKRGEVWIIDLKKEGKRRPCLVLSVEFQDHEWALITYVPRTTVPRQARFEVEVRAPFFDKPGVFNAQGLGSVDHHNFERKMGSLTPEQLYAVEEAVKRWLGFVKEEAQSETHERQTRNINIREPPEGEDT